ncbi:MAG: hypothetical protein ACRCXT_20630 [Paraclostridium sp.]
MYKFKYHTIFSIITSCFIGIIVFFILKPNQLNTVQGTIKSIDNSYNYAQIDYGYNLIFVIIAISFFVILALYKPVKKIVNNKFRGK